MSGSGNGVGDGKVRYSLWLCSSDQTANYVLTTFVNRCSALAQSPPFMPHITLHSIHSTPSAAITTSDQIVNAMTVFPATLGALSMHPNHFYQCVFSVVELDEAMNAARKIAEQFVGQPIASHPHLSLAYSSLPPPDRARLIAATGRAVLQGMTYPIDRVLLVDTTHPTGYSTHWKVVKSYALPKSNRSLPPFNCSEYSAAAIASASAAVKPIIPGGGGSPMKVGSSHSGSGGGAGLGTTKSSSKLSAGGGAMEDDHKMAGPTPTSQSDQSMAVDSKSAFGGASASLYHSSQSNQSGGAQASAFAFAPIIKPSGGGGSSMMEDASSASGGGGPPQKKKSKRTLDTGDHQF